MRKFFSYAFFLLAADNDDDDYFQRTHLIGDDDGE
jgi:hypothetical protein